MSTRTAWQVLTDLVDNALRHTNPGAAVRVGCTDRGWSSVELTGAEIGDGVATEHLEHVFARFYRVDAKGERFHRGSGIGLSNAKALVEAHCGTISATSPRPGQRLSFTCRLRERRPQ